MKCLAAACGSGLPVVAVDSGLPFSDRSFETVMLLEVIEHVPELKGILKDAFRVARRNVLVTIPNSECLDYTRLYAVASVREN